MTYRDPREALQAENDCLRQELKETQEELAAARGAPAGNEYERRRWALGMRCLGSLAMVAPFLAMMTLCEHRAMRRSAWHSAMAASGAPLVHGGGRGGCPMAGLALGFERFTQAVERPARVAESTYANIPAGSACTVRVVPVSEVQFNCHVSVICNGTEVYGRLPYGFAHCDVDQSRVIRAVDPDPSQIDGDAAVTADLTSGRVLVEDGPASHRSRLSLTISQPITR